MGFWNNLFGKNGEPQAPDPEPERSEAPLSIDSWLESFNYGGLAYPVWGNGTGVQNNREVIANDFSGYASGALKASGPIFACCAKRFMVFAEARFGFQPIKDNRPGELEYHPSLKILDTPWHNGTTGDLLTRAMQDVDLAGNFFAVRDTVLGKDRIRRLRPDWVQIILSGDPMEEADIDVLGYIYKPGNTDDEDAWKIYPANGTNGQIIHWAPYPDPEAMFRGMSWMTPIVREIMADKAIAKHKLKFFENGATPNIAVSMKETVTPEKFAQFKRLMESSYSGVDNAYKTMYLGGGADVTPIGAMIQQLDFKDLNNIGEERICAAAGVHPAIAGLGPGLEGSSLNSGNFEAAKELFVSSTLRPLWRTLCASLEPLLDLPENGRLWYDDRDVTFLREDREKIARRMQIDVTSITRLVMNGFTWDSSVQAVNDDDVTVLDHTGLFSVQLLPPGLIEGTSVAPGTDKPKEGSGSSGKKTGTTASKANNTPTGSKRKPPGRPPSESKSREELIAEIVRRAQEDPDWLRAVLNGDPLPEEENE